MLPRGRAQPRRDPILLDWAKSSTETELEDEPYHVSFLINRMIALTIQVSRESLTVSQGSLYPALHRLEAGGFVSSEMKASDNNRRARVYTLTTAGKRRLESETADWREFSLAIRRLLQQG